MAEDKEPRCEVWTTGLFGVNVVDSPLHLVDGELLQAQNAEPFTEEGEGGIRKRGGIAAFGSNPIGSPIVAISSIPLVDPLPTFSRLIALPITGGVTPRTSTNGTSWSNLNGLSANSDWTGTCNVLQLPSIDGKIWYPTNACTAMQSYNGVGVQSETPFPAYTHSDGSTYAVQSVSCAVVKDGFIWWLCHYIIQTGPGPGSCEIVWKHDVDAGSYSIVGQPWAQAGGTGMKTGLARSIDVYQGSVYAQADLTTGVCLVARCNPDSETTWTNEDSFGGGTAIELACGIANDDDTLYVGYGRGLGITGDSRLRKRDSGGTWSTCFTVAAGGTVQPVHVAGERVLVWRSNGLVSHDLMESLDSGGSFSSVFTDTDVIAATSTIPTCRLIRLGTVEFLAYTDTGASTSRIIRNNGGWSVVESYGFSQEAGLLGGI